MRKRNIVVLFIAIGLVALITFSYAIISPEVNSEDLVIDSKISSPLVFTAEGSDSLTANVSFSSMTESAVNNIVATTNDTVVITLDTDAKEAICCNYDLIWEWSETSNTKNQYKRSDETLEEYVVKGTKETYHYVDEVKTVLNSDPTIYKGHVPNYDSEENVLFSSSICNEENGQLYSKIYQDFAVTTEFYNLNVNQDHLQDASLNGLLSVGNLQCSAN